MFKRLYLHTPFCLHKCGYCAFNSQELQGADLDAYVALLCDEMRLLHSATPKNRPLESIYLGGGTPSLLNAKQVEQLIAHAGEFFGVAPGSEITLEANPGTIDQTRLAAFRAAGINRLSLGIQSFDDNILHFLGRIHNAHQAEQAVDDARQAGFSNIGIDLMHSLPAQSIAQWQADLQHSIRLAPDHISIYGLTVEEGTPLFLSCPEGSPERVDEDLSADMFELADDLLTAAGYEHYEIANYARPGYRSRHNSGYWRRDGCLGLGAGAHSFLEDGNGVRYRNLNGVGEYGESLNAGHLPHCDSRHLSRDDAVEEYMFLGLRLADGINLDDLERKFGRQCRTVFSTTIDECAALGLLSCDGPNLRLTRRGMLLSNQVFSRFLR